MSQELPTPYATLPERKPWLSIEEDMFLNEARKIIYRTMPPSSLEIRDIAAYAFKMAYDLAQRLSSVWAYPPEGYLAGSHERKLWDAYTNRTASSNPPDSYERKYEDEALLAAFFGKLFGDIPGDRARIASVVHVIHEHRLNHTYG